MTTGPKLFFLLMLIFMISFSGNGQHNKIQRFTTENGLSSNVVYPIIQDSKGYLWIGTNDGLNRYDGYGFKIFRNIAGDSASLIANTVSNICEDSQGNIWVATQGGICRFNYAKNNFTRIKLLQTDPYPVTRQMIQVNKDELMILESTGISVLNIHTLDTRKIAIGDNNIDLFILHPLSKDKKGNIYLVAFAQDSNTKTNTVLIYDAQQRSFNKFLKFQPKKQIRGEVLSHFFIDSHNASWIGTSGLGELFHYSPGDRVNMSLRSSKLTTKQRMINKVFEDNDGNIWVITAKGVFLFDHSTGNFSNYPIDPSGANATVATSITQDITGVIWIGCMNGLYKINPPGRKFRSITKNSGNKTALLNNFVLGIRATSLNKIMIEYYWGIPEFSLLDLPNQTIDHHLLKDYNFIDYLKKMIFKNPEHFDEESFRRFLPLLQEHKKFLENHYASSLLIDNQKNLWLLMGGDLKK